MSVLCACAPEAPAVGAATGYAASGNDADDDDSGAESESSGSTGCEGGPGCSCEDYFYPDAATFTPCGGDIVGAWSLTRVRSTVTTAYVSSIFGDVECDAVSTDPSGDLTIVLQALQDGRIYFEVEGRYEQTVAIDGGCVNDWCSSLEWSHDDPFDALGGRSECSEGQECGACTCPVDGTPTTGGGTGGWSPVSVSLPGGYADYCRIADTLQLHGGSLLFDFEPIEIGTPAACADRSPETCAMGEGCTLGMCDGSSPECEGADEATCTASIDCVWSPETCTGEPSAPCTLPDIGIVPGCEG